MKDWSRWGVALALGLGLFGAWGLGRMGSGETQVAGATGLERAEGAAEAQRLAAELEQRERMIADLRGEMRLLEGQLAMEQATRNDAAREPEAVPEELEQTHASAALSARRLDLASLREALPEEFARLSAEELEMLTQLDLHGEEITDADLVAIAGLTHLRDLSLRGSLITDAGLVHLGPQLESLVLRGTGVGALGLSNLNAPNLQALHLCDTHVTGADLYRLPPMPGLKTLKLNFLDLDDTAVETIGSFPSLRHVELDQTKLTDAGLRQLLVLNPKLERIELRDTQVTSAGAKQLSQQFPGCELVLGSGNTWLSQH